MNKWTLGLRGFLYVFFLYRFYTKYYDLNLLSLFVFLIAGIEVTQWQVKQLMILLKK